MSQKVRFCAACIERRDEVTKLELYRSDRRKTIYFCSKCDKFGPGKGYHDWGYSKDEMYDIFEQWRKDAYQEYLWRKEDLKKLIKKVKETTRF